MGRGKCMSGKCCKSHDNAWYEHYDVGSAAHTKHYDVICGKTTRVCRGVGTEKRVSEARDLR